MGLMSLEREFAEITTCHVQASVPVLNTKAVLDEADRVFLTRQEQHHTPSCIFPDEA
jgi:hypothetical protein